MKQYTQDQKIKFMWERMHMERSFAQQAITLLSSMLFQIGSTLAVDDDGMSEYIFNMQEQWFHYSKRQRKLCERHDKEMNKVFRATDEYPQPLNHLENKEYWLGFTPKGIENRSNRNG